jgi:RNA polymerase sigma-70 factor (ECF subfamily)
MSVGPRETSPAVPGVSSPQRGSGAPTPLSLLEQVRAREAGAWARLFALYQPLVRSWCLRAGVRSADVDDVIQEVFTATASGLDGFRRDRPGDTFRGWLRGIARNLVLLHFRRSQRQPQAEGGSNAWQTMQAVADLAAAPGDDDDDAEELGALYQRALDQVGAEFEERTWQAFWLTTVAGRPPATLTDELGMSVASIRQAKCRVLRRLKREMGELLA